MSNNLIQYAFTAGEVSRRFFGRSDLEKYDLGVALSHNFYTDYNGGISNCPGTIFRDFIMEDDKAIKLSKFTYAPSLAQTYTLIFGHQYVRFFQAGGYVLEATKNITAVTKADPGVVTVATHGYSTGNWVKISSVGGMTELNNRTFEVGATTTNTFELLDPFGNDLDTTGYTTYTTGGTVARIYTVTTPYDSTDLAVLQVQQRSKDNLINLTHPDYAPRTLTRNDHADWTLATVSFENDVTRPTGLTLTASTVITSSGYDKPGSDGGGYVAAVTAVDSEGRESLASLFAAIDDQDGGTNGTSFFKNGKIIWAWDAQTDVAYYNLYRSLFRRSWTHTGGETLGYLAKAYGVSYADQNSVPDFTKSIPSSYDPFANAGVLYIDVTAGGSGYAFGDTIALTGGGSGFVGQLVVNYDTGAIDAVIVLERGSGYTSPSANITTSGGSSATFDIFLTPASGNNPAVASLYQERQIYAATLNQPLTIWGSKIDDYFDFSISDPVQESDGYEFTLDNTDVSPIRFILPTRGGLLVFTQTAISLLTGGPESGISSLNALADPQAYNGCALIPPITIDIDVLYIEGKGSTVRLLSYNDFSKVYGGTNMSILANHLFPVDKPIVDWGYAESPHKIVWVIRSDGVALPFTYVKEQNVYAWGQRHTQGLFEALTVVQEDTIDTVNLVVKRYINGRWTKFIEEMHSRQFTYVEDAWFVDCGLSLGSTSPAAALTMAAATGTDVVFTASASVFSSGDVGKVIRAGGGKATIVTYTSGTEVECDFARDVTDVVAERTPVLPLPVASGDWTMDTPTTTISGLWHLEGETLTGLADGSVVPDLTVVDGTVTLPYAATRVILGLSYQGIVKALPPTARDAIIEHRIKNIIGVGARRHETRGLKVGMSLDNLYEIYDRTDEDWDDPTDLRSELETTPISAEWDVSAQTYFVQDYPLPATILGVVLDLEIGDDND